MNPPEGAEKITPALIEPRTQETEDGGAEPLPNHPDAAKAAAAPTPDAAPPAADAAAPAKRKRRTKAEMEAARAAAAAASAPAAPTPEPARYAPDAHTPHKPVYATGYGQTGEVVPPADPPTESEFRAELAAAAAQTEGHVIMTDDLRTQIEVEAVDYYLRNLSLEGAIALVRERMFKGMKTLEIEQ